MSLIERFKDFMEENSINASQLAENIGVQKSSISHILSGRNKPSLDFVVKLLRTYPTLDIYWLLNGSQKKNLSIAPINEKENSVNDLFSKETTPNPTNVVNNELKTKIADVNEKSISKIVIFYNDLTFDEFKPNI